MLKSSKKLKTGNRLFTYVSALWTLESMQDTRQLFMFILQDYPAYHMHSCSPALLPLPSNCYLMIRYVPTNFQNSLLEKAPIRNHSNSVKGARNVYESI